MKLRALRTLIVLFLLVLLISSLGHSGMAMGGGWAWIFLLMVFASFFLLMGGLCGHGSHGHGGHSLGEGHAPKALRPPDVDTADIFLPESERRVGAATVREGRLASTCFRSRDASLRDCRTPSG
jgi:hypothetical protein